ncbi:MAG: ATP-binding cassette domain-containing protein [Magnetococcales bacterium]|nr:ATP-binding cassette domain-containing protein [Magnetococcales bacterium]
MALTVLRVESLTTTLGQAVSLALASGEILGIRGASGCGKSLLLRALVDLDLNTGEVWLDNRARSTIPAHQWRRQVGLLPAESHWWSDRVGDHFPKLLWPDEWLSQLGLNQEALSWSVNRLSSGERQRLALLRLLASRPNVLLLDEPTANLDGETTLNVEKILLDLRQDQQIPMIWVSHDPNQLARVADRVLVMEAGGFIS